MKSKDFLDKILITMFGTRMISDSLIDSIESLFPKNYLNSRLKYARAFNADTISRILIVLHKYLGLEENVTVHAVDTVINEHVNDMLTLWSDLFDADFDCYKIGITDDAETIQQKREDFYSLFESILELCADKEDIPTDQIRTKCLHNLKQDKTPIEPSIWYCPQPTADFYGRQKELNMISERLATSNYVILSGISGIGKTEIAKKYAKDHEADFSSILFIDFKNTLHETIAGLKLNRQQNNDNTDAYKSNLAILSQYGPDTLIIFDHFNILPENEPDFMRICSFRFKIIFTTTYQWEDSIRILPFGLKQGALELFRHYCPRFSALADDATIDALLTSVECHTYAIVLIGKLLQNNPMAPADLLKLFYDHNLKENKTAIVTLKDGTAISANIYGHLTQLFNIMQFQEDEELPDHLIEYCAFVPDGGITLELFSALSEDSDCNGINRLCRLALISIQDNQMVTVHSLIRNIILEQLTPSYTSCQNFINNVTSYVSCSAMSSEYMKEFEALIILLKDSIGCPDDDLSIIEWAVNLGEWITFLNSFGNHNTAFLICYQLYEASEEKRNNLITLIGSIGFAESFNGRESYEYAKAHLNTARKVLDYCNSHPDVSSLQSLLNYYEYKFRFTLAYTQMGEGHYEEAISSFKSAAELVDSIPSDKYMLAQINLEISTCLINMKRYKEAIEILITIKSFCETELDSASSLHTHTYMLLEMCYQFTSQPKLATEIRNLLEQSIEWADTKDSFTKYYALMYQSESDLVNDDYENAYDKVAEAISFLESNNNNPCFRKRHTAYSMMAYICHQLKQPEDMHDYNEKAYTCLSMLYSPEKPQAINYLFRAAERSIAFPELEFETLRYLTRIIYNLQEAQPEDYFELNFSPFECSYSIIALRQRTNTLDEHKEFDDLYDFLTQYDTAKLKDMSRQLKFFSLTNTVCFALWYTQNFDKIWKLLEQTDGFDTDVFLTNVNKDATNALHDQAMITCFFMSVKAYHLRDYAMCIEISDSFINWIEPNQLYGIPALRDAYVSVLKYRSLASLFFSQDHETILKWCIKCIDMHETLYPFEEYSNNYDYSDVLQIILFLSDKNNLNKPNIYSLYKEKLNHAAIRGEEI